MNTDELKTILDNHKKWFLEEGGEQAYLSGADLSGADLSRANLSRATLNWTSHSLLSGILLRSAGDDVKKRMVVGLVVISTDWCWEKFLSVEIDPKLRDWALDTLAAHDNLEGAPETILARAKSLKKETDV